MGIGKGLLARSSGPLYPHPDRDPLGKLSIGGCGQKFLKFAYGKPGEQFSRALKPRRSESLIAKLLSHSVENTSQSSGHHLTVDRSTIIQTSAVAYPLPELGPRDLRCSGIFHKVVDGNA